MCLCIHSFEFIEQNEFCDSKNRFCVLIDDVKRVKSREREIAREKYRMGESKRVKL